MKDYAKYLKTLYESYTEEFDEPDYTIEFRREPVNETIPTMMDVHFFLPADDAEGEDNFTLAATAGMSGFAMPGTGDYLNIEFVMKYKGNVSKSIGDPWAKSLAELAVIPFREGFAISTPLILDNVRLLPFENMSHVLLASWDYQGHLFLPNINPKVPIIRVIPLYAKEAQRVREKGYTTTIGYFLSSGVALEDYERKEIS